MIVKESVTLVFFTSMSPVVALSLISFALTSFTSKPAVEPDIFSNRVTSEVKFTSPVDTFISAVLKVNPFSTFTSPVWLSTINYS